MLLHAQHVCHSTENVISHKPDTVFLIIAIVTSSEIPGNLFFRSGTENNARITSVEKVKQSLMIRYDLQDAELLSK